MRWIILSLLLAATQLNVGTGVIAGRVFDAVTKQPLEGVKIRLLGNSRPLKSEVVTDANGAYSFIDLPPGKYLFRVERTGYHLLTPDGTPATPITPPYFELGNGQRAEEMHFAMNPGAAIHGMVTDDGGRPLVDATVTARMTDPTVMWVGTATTNRRGEYEITGVPTGNYFVEVTVIRRINEVVGVAAVEWPRTLYPGVRELRDATAINVGVRDVVRNINIVVSQAPPRGVSGKVITPTGTIPSAITVVLESSPAKSRASMSPGELAAGRFGFTSAKSGRYLLWARALFGDDLYAAVLPVALSDAPYEVDLVLAPTGSVAGRVLTDNGFPLPSDGMRVVAVLADGETAVQVGAPDGADVLEDGTFSITGLFGERIFQINGLPSEWTIKKVLAARREVKPPHISVRPAEAITDIQIVIGFPK